MFIRRSKYEVEKLIAQQRIEHLEHIICPKGHDYVNVGKKLIGDGQGYGDLYSPIYICSRCGKIRKD